LTPRDSRYEGKENTFTLLRPELVVAYREYCRQAWKKQNKKSKEEIENGKEEDKDKEKKDQASSSNGKAENEEKKTEKEEKKSEKETEEAEEDDDEGFEFSINPNVLCDFKLMDSQDIIQKDEQLVKDMSKFLMETMIPTMARQSIVNINVIILYRSKTFHGSCLCQWMDRH
jgi:hypothetical protein